MINQNMCINVSICVSDRHCLFLSDSCLRKFHLGLEPFFLEVTTIVGTLVYLIGLVMTSFSNLTCNWFRNALMVPTSVPIGYKILVVIYEICQNKQEYYS